MAYCPTRPAHQLRLQLCKASVGVAQWIGYSQPNQSPFLNNVHAISDLWVSPGPRKERNGKQADRQMIRKMALMIMMKKLESACMESTKPDSKTNLQKNARKSRSLTVVLLQCTIKIVEYHKREDQ